MLRRDELFESFRYRFDVPAEEVFLRPRYRCSSSAYLRPGDYSLVLKLEDLNTKSFFRSVEGTGSSQIRAPRILAAEEGRPDRDGRGSRPGGSSSSSRWATS